MEQQRGGGEQSRGTGRARRWEGIVYVNWRVAGVIYTYMYMYMQGKLSVRWA